MITTWTYDKLVPLGRLSDANIATGAAAKAKDRRALMALLYGTWFTDQRMKLGRDYEVFLITNGPTYTWSLSGDVRVRISFRHEQQATLFKLTWGGS